MTIDKVVGLNRLTKVLALVAYAMLSVIVKSDLLFVLGNIVFLWSILSALEDIKENIVYICFQICFFVFLMSGPIVQEYFGAIEKRQYTDDAIIHSYVCIFISQIMLHLGFVLNKKYSKKKARSHFINYDREGHDKYAVALRRASKQFYYVTIVFAIVSVLDIGLYVINNGYMSFYLEYTSRLPLIITKIGDLAPLAIAVFIATNPNKVEMKKPLVIYAIYGLMTLLTGKRYEAVFVLMFVFISFCYCGKLERKHIFIVLFSLPAILLGLQLIEYIRAGLAFNEIGVLSLIIELFNSIGGSAKVIRFGYMYQDLIPSLKFYSFGSLTDYLLYNDISKFLFNIEYDKIKYAFDGHSFSNIVTYLWSPELYANGNGLGSCYIAELYQDFGYVGVAVGNLLLSYSMNRWINIYQPELKKRVISFFVLFPLLITPRASFSMIPSYIFNLKYLLGLVIIFSLGKGYLKYSNSRFRRRMSNDKKCENAE